MDLDDNRIKELPPLNLELDWYLYFCMRDDAVTSVAVDLTFGAEPEDSPLSSLTIIKIDLLEPDGGLASGTEAVLVDELQERLEEVANHLGTGILNRIRRRSPPRFRYVGRVTGGGTRQLYFYGTAAMPEIVYKRVFSDARFDPYEVASAESEDPKHATYWEDLHPGAALNPIVLGDAQIEVRKQQGDDVYAKREVEHALWFPTAADRQAFLDLVAREDETGMFTIDSASMTDSSNERFPLTMTSMESVDKMWTNIFVVALSDRAAKFGGTYDGWSAQVITPSGRDRA